MGVIEINEGGVTSKIDEDVYEYITCLYPGKWHLNNKGYLQLRYKGKTQYIHRLVFEANNIEIPEDKEIDHIDRCPLNNTLENLRIVSRSINNYNRGKKENTSSKYVGVSYYKRHKKYQVHIRVKGKLKHLGYFDDAIEAAYAYNVAKRKILDDDKKFVYNDVDNLLDDFTKDKIEMDVLQKF